MDPIASYSDEREGSEAQWNRVKHLILEDAPQLRLFADVTVWREKIELFRGGEDERLIAQNPTIEDLAVHKTLLHRLIHDGQHLITRIRQIGLMDNAQGITAESVATTVELLEADYRGWHVPMPPEQQDRILREVFPDVA